MINASLMQVQIFVAKRLILKQASQQTGKITSKISKGMDKLGKSMKMKQTQSTKLHQYWSEIYSESGIPERSQIEPMAIRELLGDIFILEFEPNGDINYRLAGTRLCAAFGRELKGEKFNAPWQDDGSNTIQNIVSSAARDTTIAVFGSIGTSKTGRSISFETLILPLLQNARKSRRMLGITTSTSRPYWLGADPITDLKLSSLRIIEPENGTNMQNSRFKMFKNDTPNPVSSSIMAKKVKHLTVLDGGLSANKENSTNLF